MHKKLRKGDRIKTSGKGRTAKWSNTYHGIVTHRRLDSVFVVWDEIKIDLEDEMAIEEVELI